MVRFEKLIWEKLVNTKALGRERVISSPKKWFTANRHREVKVAAHYYFTGGIRSALFRTFESTLSWLFWKWPRDIALQRGNILTASRLLITLGLAMEDFLLHQDRELRRDYLFEHIIRQSCHPYQHLLLKRRRARYYKVERAVRGFFVPDYLKQEADSRLLADTVALKDEWEDFTYTNFMSDITPNMRYTAMHRLIPLEVFNLYGILRTEAWDRLFYNEILYDFYTDADYQAAENPFGIYNLDREDGRRQFEAEVKKFIDIYPGTIVQKGEEFDFKEFYAKYAVVRGKDTSKIDPKLVEELRTKIEHNDRETSSLALPDKKVGHSDVGTIFPRALRTKNRKVLM